MLFNFSHFIFGFSLVWCLCFGFPWLCWCARELRKSIELKKIKSDRIEKQHIYRYTGEHRRALPPMHVHTRERIYAGIRESNGTKEKNKILFTEWECGAIFSSFSTGGSKWDIESEEWKRRIERKIIITNAAFNLRKQRPQHQQHYLRSQQQTGRDKHTSSFKSKQWIAEDSA